MKGTKYNNYLLIMLMLVLAFNFSERMALGMVMQEIKTDLGLTDTQLGFLTGLAFALFYALLGVPLARWADRGNRVAIIALSTALCSVAVALCGAAMSFVQLFLIRIGVAIGEAGCYPPSYSLIGDHFTRAERPRAVSRMELNMPLTLIVGYFAAGWLNDFFGWRKTFAILALPGLVLAPLVAITLKEPRRINVATVTRAAPSYSDGPRFKEVCVTLWANTAFRHLVICYSVVAFFSWGILQWQPTLFIRSHGMHTGELGNWFALIHGACTGLGIYMGGEWAARYAASNERLQLRASAMVFMILPLLQAYAFVTPSRYVAFTVLAVNELIGSAQGPLLLATLQALVPVRMRATSIAIVYLFSNLIGNGFGPLTAGALSDGLRPWFGEESLRYALVMLCPGYFWAAGHVLRASRTVARDVAVAHADDNLHTRDLPHLAIAKQ